MFTDRAAGPSGRMSAGMKQHMCHVRTFDAGIKALCPKGPAHLPTNKQSVLERGKSIANVRSFALVHDGTY